MIMNNIIFNQVIIHNQYLRRKIFKYHIRSELHNHVRAINHPKVILFLDWCNSRNLSQLLKWHLYHLASYRLKLELDGDRVINSIAKNQSLYYDKSSIFDILCQCLEQQHSHLLFIQLIHHSSYNIGNTVDSRVIHLLELSISSNNTMALEYLLESCYHRVLHNNINQQSSLVYLAARQSNQPILSYLIKYKLSFDALKALTHSIKGDRLDNYLYLCSTYSPISPKHISIMYLLSNNSINCSSYLLNHQQQIFKTTTPTTPTTITDNKFKNKITSKMINQWIKQDRLLILDYLFQQKNIIVPPESLDLAAKHFHLDVIQLLMKYYPNLKASSDAIDSAAKSSIEVVKYLLLSNDATFTSKALSRSISHNRIDIFTLLINHRVNQLSVQPIDGGGMLENIESLFDDISRVTMSQIAKRGYIEMIKYLDDFLKDMPDTRSLLFQESMIMHAASRGQIQVIEYLMTRFPEFMINTNAIQASIVHGSVDCLSFLLDPRFKDRVRNRSTALNFATHEYIESTIPDTLFTYRFDALNYLYHNLYLTNETMELIKNHRRFNKSNITHPFQVWLKQLKGYDDDDNH